MGAVFNKLGLETGFIAGGMDDLDRKKAYLSDILMGQIMNLALIT